MNGLELRQRAREAEDKAWATTSDDLRARWLDFAQAVLIMATDDERRKPQARPSPQTEKRPSNSMRA